MTKTPRSLLTAVLLSFLTVAVAAKTTEWAPAAATAVNAGSAAPALVPAPLPNDMLKATIHRLSNGLTVYLSPNDQTPRISAWIAVRTGSRNDPGDCTGLAHYLEHMLFKGSERMGTRDWAKEKVHLDRIAELYDKRFKATDPKEKERIYKEIDKENIAAGPYEIPNELDKLYSQMGFNGLNAFTMDEGTVYICDFPRNRAEVWATVESDRFAAPVFRLFQTELETVYEEKNMSTDSPETEFWETYSRKLFKEHPYGTQPTLGLIEHLKNPSLNRIVGYFRMHYIPNNMSIAVAGDFDRAQMLALLEKHFGAWKPAEVPVRKQFPIPPPKGREYSEVKAEAEEKVVIGWLTVPDGNPDLDALRMADWIMSSGSAGIIDVDLNQDQKVKYAGGGNSIQIDAGNWVLVGTPKKDQKLEEVEALLMGCVGKLKGGNFSEDLMQGVIAAYEKGEKTKLEGNESRVSEMTMSFVSRLEWEYNVGYLDRLKKITKADVVRVANKYLGPDRVVVYRRQGKPDLPSIKKPAFTKITLDASRQSEFFKSVAAIPAVPIEPKWVKEGVDYFVTDRQFGRLYTGPNPMNDVFSLSIGITSLGMQTDKEMGAAMDLLNLAGAGDLDQEQFKKRLFMLGTYISVSAGERWVSIQVGGLERNLEESLKLMMDLFNRPNIKKDTLKKMIEVAIGAHKDNKKNPDSINGALLEFVTHGKESSVLNELSDKELKALDQGKLVKLARSAWDWPADVRYVGNRSADEFAAMFAKVVPGPKNKARILKRVAYVKPEKTRVVFTHRDMVQSQVYAYYPAGVLDNSKQVDYNFYNEYMGGMSGVMFQEIREARALAYSAWGGFAAGHWAGDQNRLQGGLDTQADKTVEGSAVLQDLLHNPPMSATRFEMAKKAVVEGYRTNRLHFRSVPETALRWEELGIFGGDPRPANYAKSQQYTIENLGKFASQFKAAPMSFAIMGNRDRIDKAGLAKIGEFTEVPLDSLFPY
jgi:predicted Zn-dependent peptidase